MNKRATRTAILGISAFYHDSAAALVVDGEIVAAAEEERFTRKKHDGAFPHHAACYVLDAGGYALDELSAVVFFDKPLLKFERLLETYHAYAPRGLRSFLKAMPRWLSQKLFARREIRKGLSSLMRGEAGSVKILFSEHHLSHAASAFYPSPFEEAAILTVDGVGEWATATIAYGAGKEITMEKEMRFPHSLGLLYSACTQFCGFEVNGGEYKLMGLAPYGIKGSSQVERFKSAILDHCISLNDDGSLFLDMRFFPFASGLTMIDARAWEEVFGLPPRAKDQPLTQPYMDFALAIQEVTEEAMMRMVRTARAVTGSANLVMAGGVALNCVANAKIIESRIFTRVWIQPAAGDAGGAVGAALAGYHLWVGKDRKARDSHDRMSGAQLGPACTEVDVDLLLKRYDANAVRYETDDALVRATAALLGEGRIVGWVQGRMEWGPRALGNRSILADPRSPQMQETLNRRIKNRESFRPFAPSVRLEDAGEYFDLRHTSPYMLATAPVREDRRLVGAPPGSSLEEHLRTSRSDIPAVTHVDHSARVQTVERSANPIFWELLRAFKERTGCGVLVNTSFNVRDEPIVCTADDAYRCFMLADLDVLVIGDRLFLKEEQPKNLDFKPRFEASSTALCPML